MNSTPRDPIERLRAYRLEHSLTYEALGDEMREAGFPVPPRSLHLALTGRVRTRPRETTLYKINQFVARLAARRKNPRNRRRRKAA